MRKAFPWASGILIFTLLTFISLSHSLQTKAAVTHPVISQIQAAGSDIGTSDQEFVELFNPTSNSVDLTGWRLRVTSGSGANLVASMSGSISAHSYRLIGSTDYPGTVDDRYSATTSSFTANSTIVLYSDAGTTIVDKVGMGTATDVETSAAPAPTSGGSIQRKLDDINGHGQDTDNNSTDFETLEVSTPRDSAFIIATATPSATATASSTPTPSNTPTSTPTTTATPTSIPTNTASPTITATPSNTPIPSPTSTTFPSPIGRFSCRVSYIRINTRWFFFLVPQIFCGFNI